MMTMMTMMAMMAIMTRSSRGHIAGIISDGMLALKYVIISKVTFI